MSVLLLLIPVVVIEPTPAPLNITFALLHLATGGLVYCTVTIEEQVAALEQ